MCLFLVILQYLLIWSLLSISYSVKNMKIILNLIRINDTYMRFIKYIQSSFKHRNFCTLFSALIKQRISVIKWDGNYSITSNFKLQNLVTDAIFTNWLTVGHPSNTLVKLIFDKILFKSLTSLNFCISISSLNSSYLEFYINRSVTNETKMIKLFSA